MRFQVSLALGTLGDNTAITVATVDSLEQDFDVISTEMTIAIRDVTANQGPIEVGLAEQGYSVAEIVEAVDASPLSQYGTAWEQSQRKVRHYGTFPIAANDEVLNDGRPIKRKMFLKGFAHSTFAVARVYAINRQGAALTTGAIVEFTGTHWGRWK